MYMYMYIDANWKFTSLYIVVIYNLFHPHGTLYFGYNNSERVVVNTGYETKVHQCIT